ncbi:unnamed protein product [Alternaria alternata]
MEQNAFTKNIKKFFASAKNKVTGAFCIAGASNVAPARSTSISAAASPRRESRLWNGGQAILQLAQVDDLVLKLEALMLNNLDQQHIGTPLTRQQQETLYIQAGHEMLKQIEDVDWFVQTVLAYLAMPG